MDLNICDECAKYGYEEAFQTPTVNCQIWDELRGVHEKYGLCISVHECDWFYAKEDAELNAEPCDEDCYLFRCNTCESKRPDNVCDRETKPDNPYDDAGARLVW